MDKEQLKKLGSDARFIPGIYDYCDRWCERCAFTSRCMTFALSEEQFDDPETNDIRNDAFWEKLREVFETTLEMVKEDASRMGIDLDSIDTEAMLHEAEEIRHRTEEHQCCRAARAYSKMVEQWFETANGIFENKADELSLQAELELPGLDPVGEFATLKDIVDVIRWYQHQIYVKLMRAVQGKMRDYGDGLDYSEDDANGSAKVAIIGIECSTGAWGQSLHYFDEQEEEILRILAHLQRLLRVVEVEFPNARRFVRPGFDET